MGKHITIVSGDVNQGKTSFMLNMFQQAKRGDGFISKKYFYSGVFSGYDLFWLSREEETSWARVSGRTPARWNEIYEYGPFSFCRQGYEFAESIIHHLIKEKIEPIYMDEIGPMELYEKGFASLLRDALSADLNLIMSVRESALDKVVAKFDLGDPEILYVR